MRGGAGKGQGRHKKDCKCEKCIARELEKLADADAAADAQQATDATETASDATSSTEQTNDSQNQNNATTEQPAADTAADANATDDKSSEQPKSKINFDRYKRASGGGDKSTDEKTAAAGEPKVNKGRAPKPAPVVVIKGTVLLAVINFIAPVLFQYIAKMTKGEYVSDDFRLEQNQMKDLIPAADAVAEQYFKNLSPLAQLFIGYSAISWTSAMFKSSQRKKPQPKEADKK